jgi:hypothetical protein
MRMTMRVAAGSGKQSLEDKFAAIESAECPSYIVARQESTAALRGIAQS